jgi:outer membrane immunogenic protein
MRCLLVAFGLIGLLSPASAADYDPPVFSPPTLRGSDTFVPAYPSYFRWDGFYAGAQVSYTSSTSDFSGATQPLVAFSLRELALLVQGQVDQWPVLGITSTGAVGFGGFVGYNIQWENAIIGVELNYSHSSLDAVAPSSSLGRRVAANGAIYDVDVNASGSLHISDFATTRVRFGWAIDNFMPYATIGFAFGRADMAVSTTVSGIQTGANPNPPPATQVIPFFFPNGEAKMGTYLYGYSLGGGLEVAVSQNIFARADYEFIDFQRLWQIATTMHNVRLGLGVKF